MKRPHGEPSSEGERKRLYNIACGISAMLREARLSSVTDGSHATSLSALVHMADKMQVQAGEVVMDIGVGVPLLAMFFSYLTKRAVIGTDISKYFD